MVEVRKTITKRGTLRKHDIVKSILSSNYQGVLHAIEEDVSCVNSMHDDSGMNSIMLAVIGRLPSFVNLILSYSSHIDFTHTDKLGRDLLDIAMLSHNEIIWSTVVESYKTNAPHVINNWPEP